MAKILLVDDDLDIIKLVRTYCEIENYEVVEAHDGLEAINIVKNSNDIDICVLDVMMPNIDGFTALSKIREFSQIPVIMLTAKSEEYDKLHGFSIGADDFLPKPFSPRELIARVKAILKRGTVQESSEYLESGVIRVDELAREVFVSGNSVNLTPKEFDLLVFLMKNKKQVMTREQLLSKVWGFDYYGDARTVDTHVKSLRERLGDSRNCVRTVWGVGYKFEDNN